MDQRLVPHVQKLGRVVLAQRSGHLQAGPDDDVLVVRRVFVHREGGGAEEVDGQTEQRIAEAEHVALHFLTVELGTARHIGHG